MSEIIIREIEEEDLGNGFLEVLDNLRKASDLENSKAKEVLKKIKQNENHIIHVAIDGNKVGPAVGDIDGDAVGDAVGASDGATVGLDRGNPTPVMYGLTRDLSCHRVLEC